jgi:transposase
MLEAIEMPKTYLINKDDVTKVEETRKGNRDKQVDKRLHAVELRGQGKRNDEIAAQLETSTDIVSRWISTYAKGGTEALLPKERVYQPKNMSFEEEEKILEEFKARAENGQVVEVSEIKAAYQDRVDHIIGSGQIYYVLKRHNWRKVKPRSRHPEKASAEVIETSKKLTLGHKS